MSNLYYNSTNVIDNSLTFKQYFVENLYIFYKRDLSYF